MARSAVGVGASGHEDAVGTGVDVARGAGQGGFELFLRHDRGAEVHVGARVDEQRELGRIGAGASARNAFALLIDREEHAGFAGPAVLEVDADRAAIDDVTDRGGDRVGLGTLPGLDIGGDGHIDRGTHRGHVVAHLRPRDVLAIRVTVCVRDREAAGADGRRARGREDARRERVPGVDQPQRSGRRVQFVEARGALCLDV